MRKAIVLGVLALAACTAHRTENGIDVDPVSDVVGNWSSTLAPQNSSGISGTAKAESRAAGSKVTVHVMGATAGAVLPWHIHRGTCGNDKGIVGGAEAYKPLTVGADGMAQADETLKVALNEDETYFVNVHKSATELTTIVSCGELKH